MKHVLRAAALAAATMIAFDVGATAITFDDLSVGTVLSNQYAGVTFAPNAMTGAGWATNTDLSIVSATGSDLGFSGLGSPSLATGNVLRSFANWINETGDPSFRVSFATPISSFSATFAAVNDASGVQLMAYNGATLLTTAIGSSSDDQFNLSIAGTGITSVVVLPGSANDYVAVDNVQYFSAAAVPEPSNWALSGAGLLFVAGAAGRASRSRRGQRG